MCSLIVQHNQIQQNPIKSIHWNEQKQHKFNKSNNNNNNNKKQMQHFANPVKRQNEHRVLNIAHLFTLARKRRKRTETQIVSIVIHLSWVQHKWQCKSIYSLSVCLHFCLSLCMFVCLSCCLFLWCLCFFVCLLFCLLISKLLSGTFAIWLLTSEISHRNRQRSTQLND